MCRSELWRWSFLGLACLFSVPQGATHAASLRDEAVTYRIDGYQRQRRGDIAGAMEAYQKAAALDPAYPTPHNDLGVLYEEQGQFQQAELAYQQALSLDPNYLEAHSNLAMLYERMDEKEKAIFHWLKRYQLGDPADPWTARAEERLVALGVLKTYPGLKGRIFTRRRVIEKELKAHEQSLEEFHSITEQQRNWP